MNYSTVANSTKQRSNGHKKAQNGQPSGKRYAVLVYGVLSYMVFFASFLYAVGFIGGFGVPTTLDGPRETSLTLALLTNVGLLALFAVQHSVMARPTFKRWWTKIIPAAAERSTYVLLSSLALFAVFAWWEPLGGMIWEVENSLGQVALYSGFAAGWGVVFLSTFLINHFDLFGLRQSWLAFKNQPYTELNFVMPWLYRVVRHPLYFGWLMVMWFTPTMSIAHLLFAGILTAYIFIGIYLEERDLRAAHSGYAGYQKQVPMIIPRLGKPATLTELSTAQSYNEGAQSYNEGVQSQDETAHSLESTDQDIDYRDQDTALDTRNMSSQEQRMLNASYSPNQGVGA